MKFAAIILCLFAQQAAANKKSKAGSALESLSACPDLSGSSKKSGGSKQSKAGFTAGTADCGSASTATVRCGNSFFNERVYLLKDLVCDGEEDTISLTGQGAVLDCGGRTIVGVNEPGEEDIIVELHGGASVVNCNFAEGYIAIQTSGEGCSTIENVSVYEAGEDAIRIKHSGGVLVRDVGIFNPGSDGIEFRVESGKDLQAIVENVRVLDAGADGTGDGIDLGCDGDAPVQSQCGGDIIAEFYGNVLLWDSFRQNLDVDGSNDVDLTILGNFMANDSDEADGVDIDNGNTITFAAGSFSEVCGNDDNDIESEGNNIVVEDGAVVICDDDQGENICTESCDVDEALACIE